MYKASVRALMRHSINKLNSGDYTLMLKMASRDFELAFPGENSWSTMFRSQVLGRQRHVTHRGIDEASAFAERFVAEGTRVTSPSAASDTRSWEKLAENLAAAGPKVSRTAMADREHAWARTHRARHGARQGRDRRRAFPSSSGYAAIGCLDGIRGGAQHVDAIGAHHEGTGTQLGQHDPLGQVAEILEARRCRVGAGRHVVKELGEAALAHVGDLHPAAVGSSSARHRASGPLQLRRTVERGPAYRRAEEAAELLVGARPAGPRCGVRAGRELAGEAVGQAPDTGVAASLDDELFAHRRNGVSRGDRDGERQVVAGGLRGPSAQLGGNADAALAGDGGGAVSSQGAVERIEHGGRVQAGGCERPPERCRRDRMEPAGVDLGSVLFRLYELQARRDRVEQRVVGVTGEFLSATGKGLVRVRAARCRRDQYQQQHGNSMSHGRSLTHVTSRITVGEVSAGVLTGRTLPASLTPRPSELSGRANRG